MASEQLPISLKRNSSELDKIDDVLRVLILDASGSMRHSCKTEDIRGAVHNFMRNLEEGAEGIIIVFGAKPSNVYRVHRESSVDEFMIFYESFRDNYGRSTALNAALYGFSELEELLVGQKVVMLVVTDGLDNASGSISLSAALQALEASNIRCVIMYVMIGAAKDTLKQLERMAKGSEKERIAVNSIKYVGHVTKADGVGAVLSRALNESCGDFSRVSGPWKPKIDDGDKPATELTLAELVTGLIAEVPHWNCNSSCLELSAEQKTCLLVRVLELFEPGPNVGEHIPKKFKRPAAAAALADGHVTGMTAIYEVAKGPWDKSHINSLLAWLLRKKAVQIVSPPGVTPLLYGMEKADGIRLTIRAATTTTLALIQ